MFAEALGAAGLSSDAALRGARDERRLGASRLRRASPVLRPSRRHNPAALGASDAQSDARARPASTESRRASSLARTATRGVSPTQVATSRAGPARATTILVHSELGSREPVGAKQRSARAGPHACSHDEQLRRVRAGIDANAACLWAQHSNAAARAPRLRDLHRPSRSGPDVRGGSRGGGPLVRRGAARAVTSAGSVPRRLACAAALDLPASASPTRVSTPVRTIRKHEHPRSRGHS